MNDEYQYLNLLRCIIESGAKTTNRTSVPTRSLFGHQMKFSLKNGIIPLLTTKYIHWRTVAEELLWFISGSTNSKILSNRGVKIWNVNGSRKNLDTLGFSHREEGDLGPIYGFQWRHYGAKYISARTTYGNQGIDQLQTIITLLRKDPHNRRMVMTAWNPKDLDAMVLPPCHCMVQFYVNDCDELSCQLYQRSADMGLGVPINIASYSLLTHMLSRITGLQAGEFIHTLGNCHVYEDHVPNLLLQLNREPRSPPTLEINNRDNLKEIDDFTFQDFIVKNYNPHSKLHLNMHC